MTTIIVVLVIFGSILLGLISMVIWMYRNAHQDNEYWDLFHDHDHDYEY